MSQLSVLLQDTARRETEVRTILGLLREQMDDFEGGRRGRPSMTLKERLGFKGGFGCCGATWGFRSTSISVGDHEQQPIQISNNPSPGRPGVDPAYSSPSGMNLAAALAAERQFREANSSNNNLEGFGGGTPVRVSLMRLLEETSTEAGESCEKEREREGGGNDTVCCVCMVRKKGAALIPCGHTYCRICSREVWLNRGKCPLCNRSILEILDIF